MSLDIVIVGLVGASQLALAWYGVHVSVLEKRPRNAIIIGIIGGLAGC
jgi:hypothetical protein